MSHPTLVAPRARRGWKELILLPFVNGSAKTWQGSERGRPRGHLRQGTFALLVEPRNQTPHGAPTSLCYSSTQEPTRAALPEPSLGERSPRGKRSVTVEEQGGWTRWLAPGGKQGGSTGARSAGRGRPRSHLLERSMRTPEKSFSPSRNDTTRASSMM